MMGFLHCQIVEPPEEAMIAETSMLR